MKKSLNVLLHEVFIINIQFVFKLMKRYYYITIAGFVLTAILFYNFYSSQHRIYERSIAFRIVSETSETPSTSVAKMLGDTSNQISADEIIGIKSSPDFLQTVAKEIIASKDFPKFNFNNIHSKKVRSQAQIIGGCADIKCRESMLRGIVMGMFSIVEDGVVQDRFILKVRTLDEFTTSTFLEIIKQRLIDYRKETIRRALTEQRTMSEKIIEEKTLAMKKDKVYEKVKRVEDLKEKLKAITKKIELLNNTLAQYEFDLINTKSNLKEANKVKQTSTAIDAKAEHNKYLVLKKRRDNLASDISALENADTIFDNQDKSILDSLRAKLAKVNEELLGYTQFSDAGSKEKFIEMAQGQRTQSRFKVKVLEDKIVELKKQLRVEHIRKDAYESEGKKIDQAMKGNSVSFDYLKLLQQKLVQLKLLESTVISDIVFDKFVWGIRTYKEKSVTLMLLFSFVISMFSVVVALIAAFVFDKKILDEEEFKAYYKDIPILGRAPVTK